MAWTHLLRFSVFVVRKQNTFLETEVRRLFSSHELQFGFKRIDLKVKLVEVEVRLVGFSVVDHEQAVIQCHHHFLVIRPAIGSPPKRFVCV